jgi:simple sugar transport system ATP-binding protein
VVRDVSARYGLAVEPGAGIWELSVGEQQRVEIIKMLLRNVSVLILDEPTAVLTPSETDALFATMRGIAGEGRTIIFISHKLREVMQISDRITIMRKGRKIITLDTESTDERDLAHHMIGGDVAAVREPSGSGGARPVVELRGLWARSDRLLDALKGIDLTVHEAEIVGVAGVSGNGQKELEEVLAGLRPSTRGAVWLTGKDLSGASPAEMISQGLGCIPGDRHKVGTASGLGAVDNLILKRFRMPPIASGILLDYREATLLADELIEGYRIAVPDASAPVRLLSGGNLQKIILARELYSGPRFLLAVHPTRGLDVGAAQFIRNALLGLKETGAGILLISEDLEEICALSDRVAVMYGGRIMGVLPRGEATMERLGLLMTGQHCGI